MSSVREEFGMRCMQFGMSILNAAFCKTFSLLMLVEDARGDHME